MWLQALIQCTETLAGDDGASWWDRRRRAVTVCIKQPPPPPSLPRLYVLDAAAAAVLTTDQKLQRCSWLGSAGGGLAERRSGEVHGPQCVVVDLNGLGQRLRVPAVALP